MGFSRQADCLLGFQKEVWVIQGRRQKVSAQGSMLMLGKSLVP